MPGPDPRERRNESEPYLVELLARMTTPQNLKIEGHIKKKKVQEVKDHIKKEEMNPTISCNALVWNYHSSN